MKNVKNTRLGIAAALLIMSGGVFLSCALPIGDDWVETLPDGNTQEKAISDGAALDLAPYILAPRIGATPVLSFAASSFVGIVDWTEDSAGNSKAVDGLFEAGRVYKAGVTLYPLDGYTFTGTEEFRYRTTALTPLSGNTGRKVMLEIGFSVAGDTPWPEVIPPTVIDTRDLAPYIPQPTAGAWPVLSFAAPSFVGIVDWTTEGVSVPGFFQAGTAYTAEVSLHAMEGYIFTEVESFRYGDEALYPFPGRTYRQVELEIVFPLTGDTPWVEAVPPTVVSSLDLALYIPVPATGATPIWSFAGPNFVGTVVWPEEDATGLFLADTNYDAEVTLYPMAGYTFKNSADVTTSIDHTGKEEGTTITPMVNPGRITATISFPTTAPLPPVTDLDLTLKVAAPVKDGTPVMYFTGPQYTGTVAWAPSDGTFAGGTVYTAAITLTAAPGCTFAGIPAKPDAVTGVFTHRYGTVTHEAGVAGIPFTVIITFPETGPAPVNVPVIVGW